MTNHTGLAHWHRVMQAGNQPADLAEIIAEHAVFHSPVVHTPQEGRAKVIQYLAAAGQVLGSANFRYVRELVDGDEVLLEFVDELDGIKINGIDLMRFNADGQIVDFKVMVRPLKAVNKLWELMGAQLQRSA